MNKKLLVVSSLAGLAMGMNVHALTTNVIYMTGSTAFRGNVYTLMTNTTAAGVFDAAPGATRVFASRGNADPSKAGFIEYIGQVSGTWTIVNCAWSGSEAGIASVANETVLNSDGHPLAGSPQTWMKADGTVTGISASSPAAGEKEAASRQADLAMADSSQAVSLTQDVTLNDYGVVGIVPFTWLKNTNSAPTPSWTRLTGVTSYQLQNLLGLPQFASVFTGNVADTNGVYCVGRNKGSGTRINTLADTGYGITTPVRQYSIGGGVAFGSTQTTTLILANEQNNGYESGGNVINALKIDGSCTNTDPFAVTWGGTPGQVGWIAIGYAGLGDAAGLPVSHWLTLNGIAESDGAVEEGIYSFWGHEHVLGQAGRTSGFQFDMGQAIFDKLPATLGGSNPAAQSSGIQVQFMHVDKSSDTAFPTHN